MLYWSMMEADDDRKPGYPPGYCDWCGTTFTDADARSHCCSDACELSWQEWLASKVQPSETLDDGSEIPF
jgi:hypothetical protein